MCITQGWQCWEGAGDLYSWVRSVLQQSGPKMAQVERTLVDGSANLRAIGVSSSTAELGKSVSIPLLPLRPAAISRSAKNEEIKLQ